MRELQRTSGNNQSCYDQLTNWKIDLGYYTRFDQGDGNLFIMKDEACWKQIVDMVEAAHQAVIAQFDYLQDTGVSPDEYGLPAREKYEAFANNISSYTDGKAMFVNWQWNTPAVTPGGSAGVCVSDEKQTTVYWSCFEFPMDKETGEYSEEPKAYLINPAEFGPEKKLSDFKDLTLEQFPAMYGAWLCF